MVFLGDRTWPVLEVTAKVFVDRPATHIASCTWSTLLPRAAIHMDLGDRRHVQLWSLLERHHRSPKELLYPHVPVRNNVINSCTDSPLSIYLIQTISYSIRPLPSLSNPRLYHALELVCKVLRAGIMPWKVPHRL